MKRIALTLLFTFTFIFAVACQDSSLEEDNEFLQCMVDQLSPTCYIDGGENFCGHLWLTCTDACGGEFTGECADACAVVKDECLNRCAAAGNAVQLYCVESMPYTPWE